MEEEAVDENPLADVEGGLHRFGGDLVRLDQPGLDAERQAERQRHDHDELDQPAGAALGLRDLQFSESSPESPSSSGGFSLLRRGAVLGLPCLGRLGVRRLPLLRLGSSPRLPRRLLGSPAASSVVLRSALLRLGGLGPPPGLPRRGLASARRPRRRAPRGSSARPRRPARRSAPRRCPSAARRRGRPCRSGRAGSRAWPAARRRGPRSRVSRSSASAGERSARRRPRRTACGR